jgi:hypothetical protein
MGTKYPTGDTPVYPPRDWTCPNCFKYHSKPHFPHPGQIDDNIPVGNYGRVKFNRADKEGVDVLDKSQPIKKEFVGKQASMIQNDMVQGLFCPHCGWKEEIINIIIKEGSKVEKKWLTIPKQNCSIKGCERGSYATDGKLVFCKEHYELVK